MNDFLELVLKKIDGDPTRLRDVFAATLSHQEELMLGKMDDEIGICVERVLDSALTCATTANNGEIVIDQNNRDRVMLLTAVRCAIWQLIDERGTLQPWRAGLS